jgi:hypothetical protein
MTTSRSLHLRQICAVFFALLFPASFALAQTAPQLDPPVKPTVTGKFTGNGKPAAIKFLTVTEHDPFSDKEAITLIFSEKDPSTSKKPDFDAMFGKLGSALIIAVFREDGGVFGCQVVHSAHQKQGFSSVGSIKTEDFKIAGGNVSGRLTTGKEQDAFGEKWDVDLTFAAPLPAKLRNAAPSTPKPVASEPSKSEPKEPAKPVGPMMAAAKLPFPKDAADLEYKALVKQIQFTSPRPVTPVTKEFQANLKQQGWKEASGNLVGPKNSILKYEQGPSKLTIMINPATGGSSVKIFTENLDWTDAENTVSTKKPADAPKSAEDALKDADTQIQKALKDALKGVPGM